MRFSIFILLALFLGTGCKSVKTASGKKIKVRSADYVQKRLEKDKIDVDFLTANAKLRMNNNGQKITVNADIRMQKDEFIWMRVTKFGFEGARALITKDSIFVLNRLNKTYVASDFSYVEKQFNLPANFERLQDVLLGNAFFLTRADLKSEIKDEDYTLIASHPDGITNAYWVDAFDFILGKSVFQDLRRNRQVVIEQTNYQTIGAKLPLFSHQRNIEVSSPETGNANIQMTLSKVKVNESTTYKFEIPNHYQRIE